LTGRDVTRQIGRRLADLLSLKQLANTSSVFYNDDRSLIQSILQSAFAIAISAFLHACGKGHLNSANYMY